MPLNQILQPFRPKLWPVNVPLSVDVLHEVNIVATEHKKNVLQCVEIFNRLFVSVLVDTFEGRHTITPYAVLSVIGFANKLFDSISFAAVSIAFGVTLQIPNRSAVAAQPVP